MYKIKETIKNAAKNTSLNAYIVGGAVRDLILGKEIKDLDFLIEGDAIQFAKDAGFKIKSIHKSFNTVKVEIEGIETDIASTRTETYPNPGCLPVLDKVGVKIEEDLKRRDFTINSIAINILNDEKIDPFFGEEDIKKGVLRVLHKNSFIDDPTRILRGLDFKYRFNFDFDFETKNLAMNCAKNYNNENLSIDRIYLTLNKIFSSDKADKILQEILENEYYKIWTKNSNIQINQIDFLQNTIEKFKVEKKAQIYIMALEAPPYIKVPLKDDFEIYNFFKKFNQIQLAFYYFKTKDENALKYLELKEIKPILNGGDLIKAGFLEGKIIGEILETVLREKILNRGILTTKEDELDFVFKNFNL